MSIVKVDYGESGNPSVSKIYDESGIFSSGSWVDTGIKPTASFTFIYAYNDTAAVTFGSWIYDKENDSLSQVYDSTRASCRIGSNGTIEVQSTQTTYPILHVQIYG